MIDGRHVFDQLVKRDIRTFEYIQKIATGQVHDYTTDCLLDYPYFEKYYKMIVINISKQQSLDVDPKAIQQINFSENLEQGGNSIIIFIVEEVKETILDFS